MRRPRHLLGSGIVVAGAAALGSVGFALSVSAERPPPGVPFRDPAHGTEILRVTSDADGRDCHHAYSYWPAFNRGSTRLLASCDGEPTVFGFDPQDFAVTGRKPLFAQAPPGGETPAWEDAIWSALHADTIFCREGRRLWLLEVESGNYRLLKDFSGALATGSLAQMSRSMDDNTFAFSVRDAGANVTGFLVWRRDSDRIVLQGPPPEEGLDEVQIDKTGRYLVIKSAAQGPGVVQVRVADLESGDIHSLTDDGPDFAPGHSDNGRGTVVGADNWRNCLTFRTLSQPSQHRRILDLREDWSQDFHVSMLADDEAWVLVSFYTSGPVRKPGVCRDEILLVATDGSGELRRLGRHHSRVRDYWDSPRASASRDGRFAVFTSNWGGTDRRDVYVLRRQGDRL